MAISGILKVAAKVAKTAAKRATKKGSKQVAKKSAKKAAVKKSAAIKSKIAGSLSASSIGGLAGSYFSGSSSDQAGDQAAGPVQTASREVRPRPIQDTTISLNNVPTALVAALPALSNLQEISTNLSDPNFANVIAREDIALDTTTIGDEEVPFIPAGTIVPSSILEVGYLQKSIVAIKDRVSALSFDLGETNSRLKNIDDAIQEAIDANARTNRNNERLRDELAIENQNQNQNNEPEEKTSALLDTVKLAAKGALVALGTMVGSSMLMLAGSAMASDEEPGDNEGTGVQTEGEEQVKETGSTLENLGNWLEKAESDDNDKTIAQSAVGATMDNVGTGLAVAGVAGSVATAAGVAGTAAIAPLAAAATAGYVAGTVLYEQTGLKEKIGESIDAHLKGDGIGFVNQTSREEMANKYGGNTEMETLGDLFGEGLMDNAEPAGDIVSFFKEDVHDLDHFMKLNKEYNETYDRPLTSAINDELGMQAVEEILEMMKNRSLASAPTEKPSTKQEVTKTVSSGQYTLIRKNMTKDMWEKEREWKMALREKELAKKDVWSRRDKTRMYRAVDLQTSRDLAEGKIIPQEDLIEAGVLIIKGSTQDKIRESKKQSLQHVADNVTGNVSLDTQVAAQSKVNEMNVEEEQVAETETATASTRQLKQGEYTLRQMNMTKDQYEQVRKYKLDLREKELAKKEVWSRRDKKRMYRAVDQQTMKDLAQGKIIPQEELIKSGVLVVHNENISNEPVKREDASIAPKIDSEVKETGNKVVPIIIASKPQRQTTPQQGAMNNGQSPKESALPSRSATDSFLSPTLVS